MKVYTVGHILTVTSSSDGFRLPLWHLQTCLVQELLTLVQWDHINQFNSATCLYMPKANTWIPNAIFPDHRFFLFNCLR
jgi:hypothetical protein